MNAIAAGIRAGEEEHVARARGAGAQQLRGFGDAHAHRVHQRVAVVGRAEDDFAADGGDAEAVAVATDAPDHAFEEVAVLRVVERAEAE